ncbi:TadE/TadG family type IV pilus assembly protein [Tropicimonas sp. S265A]|uniref:TadE/TadG family type IV pilus assembly protein n=1 Tax=Tropicimonas sp. S265A TaxID=3415134 RepID=UPI003C7E2988
MISRIRKFWSRDEDGTATVEFVIVFPLIMAVFMSTFELAMLTAKYTMLDRALDQTMRDVRLSSGNPLSSQDVKNSICNRALLIKDCHAELVVEMTDILPPVWTWPTTTTSCANRGNGTLPVVNYTQATSNKLVLVRACALVDPWFPLTGLGMQLTKDPSGAFQMTSVSAFVAEP